MKTTKKCLSITVAATNQSFSCIFGYQNSTRCFVFRDLVNNTERHQSRFLNQFFFYSVRIFSCNELNPLFSIFFRCSLLILHTTTCTAIFFLFWCLFNISSQHSKGNRNFKFVNTVDIKHPYCLQ